MKKIFLLFPAIFFIAGTLSACTPAGHPNILLFTHRLADISGETVELSDYMIIDGKYKLLFEKDASPVLLTAEENEKGEIVKVHLSLSKVDENGKAKTPTDIEAQFYKEKTAELLYAFTLLDEETCRKTAEKILPIKSDDFLKTGELTLDIENFHLVYYSNKICCRFSVTNTFLEKTETTQKPSSRPFYEVTANVSENS